MNSISNEIKYAFKKSDNGLVQLIVINLGIFIIANLVIVPAHIFDFPLAIEVINSSLYLPANLENFIQKPWTLFTTFFAHLDIFHILMNMLFLYYFGSLISEYLGSKRLIAIYFWGGLSGSILYLLVYNTIPFFMLRSPLLGLIGASGSVYAIVVAAAVLLPNYSYYLIFLGPVKIKYIASFYIFISFIGTIGQNAGGNIAHLGGALLGAIFIIQLKKGNDWGLPIYFVLSFFDKIFKPKPKMKISYVNTKKEKQSASIAVKNSIPSQNEIDEILDKISKSGYESLSKEEKNKLFKASQTS